MPSRKKARNNGQARRRDRRDHDNTLRGLEVHDLDDHNMEDPNENDANQSGEGHDMDQPTGDPITSETSNNAGQRLVDFGRDFNNVQGMKYPADYPFLGDDNRQRDSSNVFGKAAGRSTAAESPRGHQETQDRESFGSVPPTSFNPGEIPLGNLSIATVQVPDDSSEEESSDFLFRSPWEAFAAKSKRHEEEFRKTQKDALLETDPKKADIPWTAKEQRRCVKEVMNAIKDVSNVIDGKTKGGKDAQSVSRIKNNYYSDEVIEISGWEITSAAINSQAGIRLVDPYHGAKLESYDSFRDRFDAIIKTLKKSKAACKQLFDAPFLYRLVDAPAFELEKKGHNKAINKKRNAENTAGRIALQQQRAQGSVIGATSESEAAQNETSESESEKEAPYSRRTARAKIGKTSQKNKSVSKARKRNNSEQGSQNEDELPPKKAKSALSENISSRGHDLSPSMAGPSSSQLRLGSTIVTRALEPLASIPSLELSDALRNQYMLAICIMLGVSTDWANRLTLEDLRLYARAYNPAFGRRQWKQQPLQGFRGVGQSLFRVVGDFQQHHQHFALASGLRHLIDLAIDRGDIDEDNLTTFVDNPILPESSFDQEALGTIENPFGVWEKP